LIPAIQIDLDLFFRDGFVKFSCDSINRSTLDIACRLGELASASELATVQTLVPKTIERKQTRNCYSGNFGVSAFPLHTDLAHWFQPPRYFLLRCVRPANGVNTTFTAVEKVIEGEDRSTFDTALFHPRKPLERRLTILRLFERGFFRWDPLFLKPLNKNAQQLETRIAHRISKVHLHTASLENPMQCILVDNWRVLHGRSAVASTDMGRVVERVYLSTLKDYANAKV